MIVNTPEVNNPCTHARTLARRRQEVRAHLKCDKGRPPHRKCAGSSIHRKNCHTTVCAAVFSLSLCKALLVLY